MAVIGELATLITARTKPFTDGLKTASTKANEFSSTVKGKIGGALSKLTGMLSSTTAAVLGFGGALTAGGIIGKSLQLAVSAENMETAYATYLKSMDKAKLTLAELSKYSEATPFESMEIKEAGKQLLAFGFAAEDLMGTIKVIGDLSAGSQKPMTDFVDILGKIKASGIASMGDINRLADRGVPIFQELAKVMGVTSDKVRDLVGSSKVGFDDVWASLKNVVSEGGLFEGAVAKMAETTSGKLSTLKDNVDALFTDIGRAILGGLDVNAITTSLTEVVAIYKQDIVDVVVYAVQNLSDIVKTLGDGLKNLGRFADYVSYLYHGTMATYWGAVDAVGKLPGASAPNARQNRLEHLSSMYEAQVSGIATTQELYGMGRGSAGQSSQQQQQNIEKPIWMIWEEQRKAAEMAERQYMLMLQQQYPQVVEQF